MPPLQEVPQQHRIVCADSSMYRRPRRKPPSPARQLRFGGQYSEVSNAVEHVEIAEYRAEHRVDQREFSAVEPRSGRDARLEPRKSLFKLSRLEREGRLVRCGVKACDIVQHRRAEFDPAAMLGARQGIGRM